MYRSTSYIEELLALQQVGFYLQDASISVLLWRSTTPVLICGRTISIPLHSATAFIMSALLVERPQFLPSFVLFGIAWLLLASMEYRRHLPDVWSRCKSFKELAECLAFGESRVPPDAIEPYTNSEASDAFVQQWQKRIAAAEESAAMAYEGEAIKQEDDTEALTEFDSNVVSTPRRGISLDPFRPILFPVSARVAPQEGLPPMTMVHSLSRRCPQIQQNLAVVCRTVRHIKYILFWEECYITFWIVSLSILLGVVFLFVPWFFLLQWSARILVWTFLGPWMKLVDVLVVRRWQIGAFGDFMATWDRLRGDAARSFSEARLRLENAEKLTAMKEYMFGRFVTRVPVLKEDRYRDMPLPKSSAVPYKLPSLPLSELAMQEAGYKRKRMIGQHIMGDMIPQVSQLMNEGMVWLRACLT